MSDSLIDRTAQALLAAAPPGSRVILFGSHARGLARPDSDWDFLVVEPEVKDRFNEMVRLRQSVEDVLCDVIQPVDVIVTDQERFFRNATVPNTLAYEAASYGRVYE